MIKGRRQVFFALLLLLIAALVPSFASAQASLQVPLEFDFLSPGARSLALGSAFVALADDATAAFTNPAGLTILLVPEVAAEGRGRRIDTRFLERGRLSGTPTNQGIDTVTGARYGTVSSSNFSPGYVSFVYPYKNKLAVAAYRHEVTNVAADFETQGVFQFNTGVGGTVRETALQAHQEMDILNYGVSFAVRPATTVSIGAGLSLYTLNLDALYTRYVTFPIETAASYDPARATFEARLTGDDTAIGVNVGALWMPRRAFQAGVVYRKAPSFEFTQTLRDLPSGTPSATSGTFHVPDAFAIGAVARPSTATMVTVEYRFVQYSSLKDYIDVQARPSGRQDQFSIDNANEFHVGVEYVFVGIPHTPAVRGGYWRDPAHSVNFTPNSPGDQTDERFAAYLPGSDAASHVTFGGGVPISTKFEINGAGDISSKRSFLSISAVVRF